MLLISLLPWRFAWLGAGFAGAEGAAEAGLQPFDEGVVTEGPAGALVATEDVDLVLAGEERPLPPVAPLDDVMWDAGSDDARQSCHGRRFTGLPDECQFNKVSPEPVAGNSSERHFLLRVVGRLP
jgi:hypothetical protein